METAENVDLVDTVDSVENVDLVDTVDTVENVETVDSAETAHVICIVVLNGFLFVSLTFRVSLNNVCMVN